MRWSGDSQSTGVCMFRQSGEKLTGTCGGTDEFPVTGEVKDSHLTWELDVVQDGNEAKMVFTGEVDRTGTTVEGSCRIVGAREGTFTLTKKS